MLTFNDIRAKLNEEHPIINRVVDNEVFLITGEEREALLDEWANNYINNAMSAVREHRNALLNASDWTQIPDAPVDASVWAEYRQELRDLPNNIKDPKNPVWPTPPE